MKRSLVIAVGVAAFVLGVGGVLLTRQNGRSLFGFADDDRAPRGVRIKVQVLNATTTRGLAARATDHLRDHGFDVVEVGTSRDRSDSVVVIDRSNHPEWAKRVAAALGGARIESRPDSSRYLDVTVLIGSAWRPPPHPFNP